MPIHLSRALLLLAAAANLTVCGSAAQAIETWAGVDGEIRVVPGTEDQLLEQKGAPNRHHPPDAKNTKGVASGPDAGPAQPAKPAKTLPAAKAASASHPSSQSPASRSPASKSPDTKPLSLRGTDTDPLTTGAIAASKGLNDTPPPVALSTPDPGNPIIAVDPATDILAKTNEADDGMPDPAAPSDVTTSAAPGALPVNPIDPTAQTLSAQATAPAGGVQQSALALRPKSAAPATLPIQPIQPQAASALPGSIPVAPQAAITPNPRSALDDPLADPAATSYDAIGLKVGSFVWRPAIELSAGGTSNIQGQPGGKASSALRLAPELVGQSDWSQHQLTIDLHGSLTDFPQDPALFRPTGTATISGRIDLADDTRLALKTSYGLDKLPSTSVLQAGGSSAAGLQQTATASAALTHDVGQFAVTMRGEADRTDYQLDKSQASTTSAASLANTDFIAALRGSYSLSEGLKPFVEVQADTRRYDAASLDTITTTDVSHDTSGAGVKSGVTLNMGPILSGEGSVGYGFEAPTSHYLKMLHAITLDDNIVWSPNRQTRVTLSTVTAIEPSLLSGASGAVSRTFGLKVSEDVSRNLTIDLGGSYLTRHYTGIYRTEALQELTSGLTWKLSPTMQTFIRGTYDAFVASDRSQDYKSATVFAGVRLQQ